MEQMPGQDSTTDFAKKRGKQKRLSLDEYAASLLHSLKSLPKDRLGSGGIRTHAPEETGALIQRLRPLGHATLSGLRFPGHFYRRKGLPNADFAE
ncbi:hypothetical protein Q8A67_020812 [Cirrhinus molitorella]|uniref:Uncharacterized protein n=1 Tax=Cirrhinus molitorella TaxID=172907 RepID=A0AA88PCJ2_9TELE|nr:hypothetical protein Q8A67_020812 [Cirrhinus molitorella]